MAATYHTPPQIAEMLGVTSAKIIGWIEVGELDGVNLATVAGGRPRYKVSQQSLDDFLRRRSASLAPAPPRRRRQKAGSVREFY